MKRKKIASALAGMAALLLAFAGTASATTITSPEGTNYTGSVWSHAFNTKIHGSFVTVECLHSYLEGDVWTHGGIGSANVDVTDLEFAHCNYPVSVYSDGSLAINSSNAVTSSGAQISIQTSVGICVFTTSNTSVGTLTEGSWADLDINSAKIPRTGGNFLCGSSGSWTGSYTIATPNPLYVD